MELPTTLAIDTSCDETSVSAVKGLAVLSNIQATQFQYHKKYGGVVPSLARLAHQERIDNVVEEALKKAFGGNEKSKDVFENIDYIAVTVGPGLAIALEVGIAKAKELARKYEKPLLIINHMEGHLFSGFALPASKKIDPDITEEKMINKLLNRNSYPIVGLLVSGKHTEIISVNSIGEYEICGETLDDACGEAFDKAGRMLGLGYPAGPIVADFAKKNRKNMKIEIQKKSQSVHIQGTNKQTGDSYELPIAMAYSNDLNFSYSGLKTAVKQLIEELTTKSDLSKQQVLDISVVFEESAFQPILMKLEKLLSNNSEKDTKALWFGGGVAANTNLKTKLRQLCKKYNLEFVYPRNKKLTTDNAAMIGVAANLRLINCKKNNENLESCSWYYKPSSGLDAIDRDPSLELN